MNANNLDRTGFRGDINGLRAWAVSIVVLYHFGVPGFAGGFVGVDVFFVISGFLMTGIIVKGLERHSFSLLGFYMSRARRILPALVVMCAFLLVLGWFILLPTDYKALSSHTVYSLAFLSNIEFWQEAGYFDVASHEKWHLHTWSLAVEWQFYMLLPLFLALVWWLRPSHTVLTWAMVAALAASFFASVLVTNSSPSAAFYLLHTRAWEMLGGGLVFMVQASGRLTPKQRRWLGTVGMLMIVAAVALFNKNTAWPGWRAALPVTATMMVLMANRKSVLTDSVPAQWLGERSYSLYLWHWPINVALSYFGLRDNFWWALPVGVFLTLLIGHYSYSLVESPSRRLLTTARRPVAISLLLTTGAAVALPALAIWAQAGVGGRFSPAIEAIAKESYNFNRRRSECLPQKGTQSPSCVYGGPNWRVIVLGDSHANTIMTALAKAQSLESSGVVEWSYGSCPFVSGLKKTPAFMATSMGGADYRCSEFIAGTESKLANVPPDIPLIIIARYATAAFGHKQFLLDPKVDVPEAYFTKVFARTTKDFLDEFAHNITQSACNLAKRHTVYLVRPIPEMGVDVPRVLTRRMMLGSTDDFTIPVEAYRERSGWVWAAQDAAQVKCGVKILDPTAYLCSGGRCFGSKDGHALYYDDNHLSEFGNKLLVPMFVNALNY